MTDICQDNTTDDPHQDTLYRAGVDAGRTYATQSATYAEFSFLMDNEYGFADEWPDILRALVQRPDVVAEEIEEYWLDTRDPFDRGFRDAAIAVWRSATGTGDPVPGLTVTLTPGQRHRIARRIAQTRIPAEDAAFRNAYERGWDWAICEGLNLERELDRIDLTATSTIPYGGMDPKVWTRLTEWIDELGLYEIVDYDPNDVVHRGAVQGAIDAMHLLRALDAPANDDLTT